MMPASGGPGGDLRCRSSLRLSPTPPIYEVMGDHGSPPEPPPAGNIHVERKPWPRVPIERHGRPRPCERRGPTIVGRMSASEPFDGTRDQGDAKNMLCNLSGLLTREGCFAVVSL